jgi:CPA2 family monovalent cation:H+ antiporter-2
VDRTLGELALAQYGVEVTAIRRRNVRDTHPDPQLRLLADDVVVLRGTEEALAAAEMKLLQG